MQDHFREAVNTQREYQTENHITNDSVNSNLNYLSGKVDPVTLVHAE